MKSILKIFLVNLLLLVPTINAATLTENTNNYIAEINEVTLDVKTQLNNLTGWLESYNNELVGILNKELVEKFTTELNGEDYVAALEVLIDALNNANYQTAAQALENINLEETINDYQTLEKDLLDFLDENSDQMNIIDGTEEGVDSLFDLYEAINSAYDSLKNSINDLFTEISDVFGDALEEHFAEIKNYTNKELVEVFKEYEEYSVLIDDMISNFYDTMTKYENVFSKLVGNETVFMNKLKNKVRDDLTKLLDKCEAKIDAPLNSFIEDRWTKLELDVDDVINSDDTVVNKNKKLYNRIDEINNINQKFTNNIKNIMNQIDSSTIVSKIKKLLNKGNKEFEDAAKYVEEHLVIGEYDIKLIPNHDAAFSINRATEIIVLDKLFKVDDFKAQIMLANEGFGTLEYEFLNSTNVSSKSTVKVVDNNEEMKRYKVAVKGDVDANGRITVTDVLETARAALKARTFDDIEFIAADLDESERITVTDVLEMATRALGQGGSI